MHDLVAIAWESRLVRAAGFVAVLAVGALSLRISLTNAFLYVNWADALTYAEGARQVYASVSPYSEMQLAGPYPIDAASFGQGFLYPPTGAYLLAPFMLGESFWYAWNALSIAAVVGVVILIVRHEVGPISLAATVAVGALTVTILQPGLTDLKTGYLSPMVAAATGMMWLWPRWSAVPSVILGLIKVVPVAGLLWTLRKGGSWRWPLMAGVVVVLVATVLHPSFVSDWLTALANAQPGCPEFALWSFGCVGAPALGYLMAAGLMVAAWRASRDDVAFLLLAVAMTVPLPDIYWGNVMVPIIAAIPLVIRLSTQWWVGAERDTKEATSGPATGMA